MSTQNQDQSPKKETATQKHMKALLERIDAFCAKKAWSEGYFSKVAAGDVGVVDRLRASGRVTGAKMDQIERYLDSHE